MLASRIEAKVLKLKLKRLKGLKTHVETKLKSKYPAGQGFLPSKADDLISAIRQYWDFLNFEFAQLVVTYLENEMLQKQMRDYEEKVRSKVQATLSTCKQRHIQPKSPYNCVPMSVTVNVDAHSYSLHRILQMKDFLKHKIGVDFPLFDGWTDGCIKLHFHILEEDVNTAEHGLKEHFQELKKLQVTRLEVFGRFYLDVPICKSEVRNCRKGF